jgi:hypothetical protein
MAETQELIVDFDNAKSGRVNLDTGVYTATTGWDNCETGRTTGVNRWRAFFSFDTSALPDDAVIERVTMNIRRRADGLGDPQTYWLKFSIGTFIGAALNGDAGEWAAGTQCKALDAKPADKADVIMNTVALGLVNRTGDTDLKLWDDSIQGTGDPTWETNFNKNTSFRCKLYVRYTEPRSAIATGVGTASADGTVSGSSINGTATATGVGTASATATLVIPGAATATGVGTAAGSAVLEVPGTGTATGVGTASGTATLEIPGAATATGVGTAAADATLWLMATATATGVGTASAAGTVSGVSYGTATATGIGTATGAAVLEIPGAGTATGIGTASGQATIWLTGIATATGVGTASGEAIIWLTAVATATGVGTATAVGTVLGNIAYWGEPCETYTGGPQRGAH